MSEAICAQKAPYQTELAPGTYWWCACGRSSKQPYCDGTHKGTEFTPIKFEVGEQKTYWLCGCKRSGTSPHCDGSHKNL
jgi:CDGSH-type Zn-finger protein